mmetsp:Transcript_12113/g.23017  ORF Transcript_12113/g.23017 Transcript_12113/m.23017 type:complete len:879 (+) Transcript_12113:141-2777(+)|eukprot:CAMPEP_0114248844 /NCGR_PEP_ID=MMETSP0058-20121206/13800_1 /TAXON_ID=36894 /ORGANISM="Pyramimonas parkeae, CCMP726" /LENGTH=878 /DNA_ID=CAMNT_0001362299 /DNA_START=140 /DNA_END=2776 /DNA_ORIENTATION=-
MEGEYQETEEKSDKRGGFSSLFGSIMKNKKSTEQPDSSESAPPTPTPINSNSQPQSFEEGDEASPNGNARYPRVDPNQLTLIEGIEHKMESFMAQNVRIYLWVDINGLKIIDAKSKHVQWSARLNTIVQWAVRDDYFWCNMIYKKGEQRERGFLTGYSKAVKLKAAMETFVNIHLKDPEHARQLMFLAEDPPQGATVKEGLLKHVELLESGQYRDPSLATKYLPKKRQVSGGVECAPISKGAADTLPENAPPPWVDVGNPKSATFNEDVEALKRQNEQLRAEREDFMINSQVYKGEIERLSKELSQSYQSADGDAGPLMENLSNENSRLEMKVKELELRVATEGGEQVASATAAATSKAKQESEQLWLAEKEVLMSMMEEKETQVESLQSETTGLKVQISELRSTIEVLESGQKGGAEHAQVIQKQLTEANNQLKALQASKAQAEEQAALRLRIVNSTAGSLRAAAKSLSREHAALRAQQAQLAEAVPEMLAHVQEEVEGFMASVDMASVEQLRALYQAEVVARKKLHNELVDLRGNIRVFCRVRPLLGGETGDGEFGPVVRFPIGNEKITVKSDKRDEKTFTYERVFRPDEDQPAVFAEIQALITSVMDGYNVTIFAYGQTGSGKTHTMAGTHDNPGVNIRALRELFGVSEERKEDYRTTISASYLEIYNENIYDLLAPNPKAQALEVKHSGVDGIEVAGLSSRPVTTVEDVVKTIESGNRNRSTFSTNMNEHSSRSHSMLSILVQSVNVHTDQAIRGKIHLVDLAGSERLSRTDATGDRLKEAQSINKSLSALGDVIASLAKRDKHVPFRNSKLTQVLQDSMEGSAKVSMFVNVSPMAESAGESMCSLNFAQRVRGVELGSQGPNTPKKPRPTTSR